MNIRFAAVTDAEAICAITNPIIRGSLITFTTLEKSQAEVAADIEAKTGRFLVAEDRGSVVGFASLGSFRPGPGYVHSAEHSIQLAPEARGLGCGRALMLRLEDVARAHDIHALIAGVSGANPAGIAFHQALGFAKVGHLPQVGRKFGQWLDLLLLQKNLSDVPIDSPDFA